ncbi:MAG: HEAT repeat domain-containing protein, partial [Actinomycetota bacterium]
AKKRLAKYRPRKYRDELKAIVENKTASGSERDLAFDALTKNPEWQGFDNWYLSLFADESLLELRMSESSVTAPLISVTDKNPDKWIPILTKLVGNKNPNIHNAAVNALVEIAEQTPSKDALTPLLPWLTNPNWAKDTGTDRRDFIRRLDKAEMPESIPGLIWLVENEDDDDAADVLAKYKDSRAVPALRSALSKTSDERIRKSFVEALIACGGFSDAEMIGAMQMYVQTILTPDGYKKVEERDDWDDKNPLPLEISIGKFLARQKVPNESFVRALFERINELQKTKADVAKKLLEIANKWQGKAVDTEILKRLADGRADVDTILTVLARRKELRESVPLELSWLTAKSGLPRAVGVAVFEDETQMASFVNQNNLETQITALACARLLRIKLPVREVGALLDSNDKLLVLAAERYLESEDSREARDLVLAKHPNEVLILGARDCFYPKTVKNIVDEKSKKMLSNLGCSLSVYYNHIFIEFDKDEEKFRREIIENKDLLEIYATGNSVLRVFRERAVFTWEYDSAIFYENVLTREELEAFHNSIIADKIDEKIPEFTAPGFATGIGQFVMLDRRGGRRIFAYGGMGAGLWMPFLLQSLKQGATKPQFKFAKNVAGLEILFTDEHFAPQIIWKNGDDFRVLVEDNVRKREISDEIENLDKLDDKNEDLDYEIRGINARKRRAEREFEQYEWRKFENGKLGAAASEPLEIPYLRNNSAFPTMEELSSNDGIRNARSGNYEIRAGSNMDTYGLWKVNRAEQIKIADGWLKYPVTTADGKWVVASKTETNWDEPNYLVRLNLQTGKESKIKIMPAKNLSAVAFVPAHHKILLRSADDSYGDVNLKYYLLDVETGLINQVKGVFAPFRHQTFRPLQSNGKPNESWAAIYDGEATEIGIYNDKLFSFKSLVKLPQIALDSEDIWVDEKDGKIYFVYNGRFLEDGYLLSIPLPNEK